jgi:hypothetical protein
LAAHSSRAEHYAPVLAKRPQRRDGWPVLLEIRRVSTVVLIVVVVVIVVNAIRYNE